MMDETDLAIVSALEVQPRADFETLAEVLGYSPATIARRWEGLTQTGEAWVTVSPGYRHHEEGWSAFISIEADAGDQEELAERLCAEPSFASVLLLSGEGQFLLDCFAASAHDLMHLLTRDLPSMPGVVRRKIDPITKIYRFGSQWRSGVLDEPEQQALMRTHARAPTGRQPDGIDIKILEELSADGRLAWQKIADSVGISAQTAKRRVTQMMSTGSMEFRCDTSTRENLGLQEVIVNWSVPSDAVDAVGAHLAADPMCRVSAQVFGAANLTATLWIHSYDQVQDHEAKVVAIAPRATVADRHVVLRSYKRMGQILNEDGSRNSTVPITWWSTK
ncbi:Lrp/AsnC family transcriptional regulator [Rothia uropygioeca]|uniref:Lrp/AsnC family transcriptional regulator n=1 Tax=Kocuria sp. 257 TaxID=2021970 RepID=UPI0013ED0C3A|nr:AsnC family transcriptional regulator [Kocuria sp. 257]